MKLMELLEFWAWAEVHMDHSAATAKLREQLEVCKDSIRAAVHEETGIPNDGQHDDELLIKASEIELGPKSERAHQEMRIFLAEHEERLFPSLTHERVDRRSDAADNQPELTDAEKERNAHVFLSAWKIWVEVRRRRAGTPPSSAPAEP